MISDQIINVFYVDYTWLFDGCYGVFDIFVNSKLDFSWNGDRLVRTLVPVSKILEVFSNMTIYDDVNSQQSMTVQKRLQELKDHGIKYVNFYG